MFTDADARELRLDREQGAGARARRRHAARGLDHRALHDTAMAFDGTHWAAGNTGENVLFPNVDAGAGTTKITMAGTTIGAGSIPLAAGTFTFLTLVGERS